MTKIATILVLMKLEVIPMNKDFDDADVNLLNIRMK